MISPNRAAADVDGAPAVRDADAALASEPFDALPDEPNSTAIARDRSAGVSDVTGMPIAIAEVSTTVDPANAHDSVTSIARTTDTAHDGFLHLFPDHTDDAT